MNRRIKASVVAAGAAVVVCAPFGASVASAAAPTWLHNGSSTQYPSAGGTWQYGFWSAKIRSYYTVSRCHGTTVVLNGNQQRSANTSAGRTSIAEKWAVNLWNQNDAYYYRTC